MLLEEVQAKNKPTDKDGGGNEIDSNVLSIHSSFIIANFEGLEAKDVDISGGSTIWDTDTNSNSNRSSLYGAFVDFLDDLMSTVCPADGESYVACLDSPYSEYESVYDPLSGKLCGSHAEYVRQLFCGDSDGGRRYRNLEPEHVIENVVLYRVQDSKCPVPMNTKGEGKKTR